MVRILEMKKYNNGLPRKSSGINAVLRMISFKRSTLALLDEKIPKRKQSKFVDGATQNKLKRTKSPEFFGDMQAEGDL